MRKLARGHVAGSFKIRTETFGSYISGAFDFQAENIFKTWLLKRSFPSFSSSTYCKQWHEHRSLSLELEWSDSKVHGAFIPATNSALGPVVVITLP